MSTLPGADWVYYASAGALALIALPLLYLALFRDRPRGRLRCPKCWYDMRGVATDAPPPFTCPECGTAITAAKRLHRTRRRWGWASFALLLILLSISAAITPKVRRDGAWSIVPDRFVWIIARFADIERWPSLAEALAARAGLPTAREADLIWYARAARVYRMRDSWVRGVPVHVSRSSGLGLGGPWGASLTAVPSAPDPHDTPTQFNTHEAWWRPDTVRLPAAPVGQAVAAEFSIIHMAGDVRTFLLTRHITLVDSIDELMTPVPDESLRQSLRPRIALVPSREYPGLFVQDIPFAPGRPLMVYGIRAELLIDGMVVGVARWKQSNGYGSMMGAPVLIRIGADTEDAAGLPTGDYTGPSLPALIAAHCTVRFSTDEEMALADLDAIRYWRGTFEVPVKDLVTPPPSE